MNLIPLYDRLLLKPKKINNTTSSGITLGTKETTNIIYAEVCNLSQNVSENNTNNLAPGNIVIFEEHVAAKFTHNGEIYYLINQKDILAKENFNA